MERTIIGWREWAGLPDLGVARLEAKIDTGAKTSALHAREIETLDIDGSPHVSFLVEAEGEGARAPIRCCEALAGERIIKSSNGAEERRLIIRTALRLGVYEELAEFSLTDRGAMSFALLIGRDALGARFLVDPQASCLGDPQDL